MKDDEGQYGPWMIVSRRKYGQKGTRTEAGTGNSIGGAARPAWTAPLQRTLDFAEGMNNSAGGPSSSRSVPRRNYIPNTGAVTKNREKMWASKATGSLNHYGKPTSSPTTSKVPLSSTKQGLSPSPSYQTHKPYPSSVKNKKAAARNLVSESTSKCAVTSGLEGLARKLTTLASTPPSSSCLDPNQSDSTSFEFSATLYTGNGENGGSESARRAGVHHVGEMGVFSASDAPNHSHEESSGRTQEILFQADVDAQLPNQCMDSEEEKCSEDQMVSDEGNGDFPIH
nr:hypothetical protein CFP56_39435 [Quercus suber]